MLLPLMCALLTNSDAGSGIEQVDPKRLEATVRRLASFQTRNTLSPGLKEACEWLASEYRSIPGLKVEIWEYTLPAGRRVPHEMPAYEVVATLTGKTDRTVLIGGHIDSLNLQADPATGRAPGANDDASGVAVALECARLMAGRSWSQTIKFVAFSGEEQGLLGSTALAKRAKAENWKLEAVLSNDTVGSSSNKAGQKDTKHVRVFSEEGTDHNSRELARYIDWEARQTVKGFGVKLVFRRDRFGRGGDHTPFVEQGFSAVRFVETHEEYTRQHTPDDLPEFMDFKHLANVARVNLSALSGLAQAGPAPTEVRVVRDQSHDTSLAWKGDKDTDYMVYWRETTSPVWQGWVNVGKATKARIDKVNKDDHVFAVGAIGGVPSEAK
ncbi:MAG: M20/M25/M40 family metallo-hydrolase [Armatimonadetes bacterium]|nr:M20/M25/M40 family metallo-hydrolase [Armatimonadota bacterium]